MLKPAVFKSARSSRPLRLAGCAAAAAGLVLAAVPAAEAGTYTVTLSCNTFLLPGQTPGEVQCYAYTAGGDGTNYTTWTVTGYTSIFEQNVWALSFYCTPGNPFTVAVSIHDGAGASGRANWSGTCA